MLPYWLFFGAYAFSALNSNRREGAVAPGALPLVFAAFLTIVFIGFRYEVGGDWNNYSAIYTYTSTRFMGAISQGDPGYMALNWLARELDVGIVGVNLCCAVLFVWGLFQFVRFEPNPWLAMLVALPYFVIVVGMGYTRQGVAIALMMAGLSDFLRGRFLRLLAYVGFAALFHKTAIVMLPLIAIAVVRYRLAAWAVLSIVGVILFQFFLSSAIERLTTNYLEYGLESGGATVRVLMNILPAVIFLVFSRHFSRSEQERKLWRNFSLAAIATLIGLYFVSSTTLVDRLALYLVPLQIVVFGRMPYAAPVDGRPNAQLMLLVLTYSAAVQFIWLTYATHSDKWVPYQNYLW